MFYMTIVFTSLSKTISYLKRIMNDVKTSDLFDDLNLSYDGAIVKRVIASNSYIVFSRLKRSNAKLYY